MREPSQVRWMVTPCAVLAALALLRCVPQEQNSTTPQTPADPGQQQKGRLATTEQLGGPRRYLTALSTDKPVYKNRRDRLCARRAPRRLRPQPAPERRAGDRDA
ncbi:MAG: hypothetical protein QM765_25085 [Myxococcales bacterium]